MWIEQACAALRTARVLELRYAAFSRWVEVHAVGYSKAGHPLMRAWQVRGGSASGQRAGWKLMRLDEAQASILSEEVSQAPRRGYRRGDPAIDRIVCEL